MLQRCASFHNGSFVPPKLVSQWVFSPFSLLIQALMTFASNPGFLAVAFMEGSAAFILLVLYWLLAPGFSARFFRYWLAGWTVYVGMEGLRIYSLWRGGPNEPRFDPVLSLIAAALFL